MIKICNYPLEYFIYIIIFILVLTIIISLIRNNSTNNKSRIIENFNDKDVVTDELDNYKKKLELSKINEDKLKVEIELIKNYTKINDNEFDNIKIHALKTYFNGITIPTLKDNVRFVDDNTNLNILISKTSNLKNIYKVGEKVLLDSTFYITNNDICFNNIPSSETDL